MHRGQDRLQQASKHIPDFLQQSADHGHVLKTTVRLLNEYLDHYGREELQCAVVEALQQQSPHPQAVQQILERRRDEKQQPPSLAVAVPDKVKVISVKTANIAHYDTLYRTTDAQTDHREKTDREEPTDEGEENA